MLWLIVWGILIITIFYYYFVRPMRYWKKRGVKQSNPVWVFGDQFDMTMRREGLTDLLIRLHNEHPNERYTAFYQMTTPTLLIKDPELIKQITVKDFDHFVDHHPLMPPDADLIWSRNLLNLSGQEWKEMRPILSPCFTGSKMKIMFQLMNELSLTFAKYFKEKATDGMVEVEMQDALSRFGNDVIASVVFGMQIDSLKDRDNRFYLLGKEVTRSDGFVKNLKLFAFFLLPRVCNFFRISFFGKEATDFLSRIIDETIKMREEKGIVRPDLIHLMLEARKENMKTAFFGIHQEHVLHIIDDISIEALMHSMHTMAQSLFCDHGFIMSALYSPLDGTTPVSIMTILNGSSLQKKNITNFDIAAQAFIFLFGGFDSVTNTMAFMASELAINPDIQQRLRDEVDETHRECNGQLTYDALMKMKYMDMVLSETMRKWPNFPITDRSCTKPYTIEPVRPNEKPLHIKTGDRLMIPIWSIHRDPKYYPEPEKFDPERFSEENKHNLNSSTFLVFGMGPRICIGSRLALMECKTLFYYLLLNFEIVPIAKSTIPKKLVKTPFTMLAEGGHWLGLKSRK